MHNPFNEEPQEPRPNRLLQPVSIPRGRAYYCPNCDNIHLSCRCPKCDKMDSYPVGKWLGMGEAV